MLNGSIWDKLPRFALPVAATAILEQLFNASDIAVVGNFTGDQSTAAVAAVGANSPIIGLVVNLFVGIALGANVVISNAIGRQDKKDVSRAVHTSVLVSLICGVIVAVLGEIISPLILNAINVPKDVLPSALLYLRIYFIGMPVILLYNFEAAIFRSIGDTKVPLLALALSGVINVILNLFFVIVFHMTVDGVAIATVISNAISAVILFVRLMRSDKWIKLELRLLKIDFGCFARMMRVGLPAGIQSAVFSLSNIVIQSAINSLGKVVMAASSAAFNIEIFAYYVMNSFTQACTTFVGQNYGAGKLDRCKKTLRLSLVESAIATGASILIVLIFGHGLLSVFDSDPEVIKIGYTRLVIIFIAYVFSMIYEVLSGYMRGFGISLVPAVLTMIGVCGVRIAWIKLVFPASSTFSTIMAAYPLSLSLTAVLMLCALLFYRPSKRFANAVSAEGAKNE